MVFAVFCRQTRDDCGGVRGKRITGLVSEGECWSDQRTQVGFPFVSGLRVVGFFFVKRMTKQLI